MTAFQLWAVIAVTIAQGVFMIHQARQLVLWKKRHDDLLRIIRENPEIRRCPSCRNLYHQGWGRLCPACSGAD